jgi:acetyltransferase-like isoleucine patch superfamily enzyme
MPIGTPVGNLDIANATLRTSNLETQNIKIGSIFVNSYPGLETTANVGNSMSNTIQFTNTHTAFTTTGNVTVGKELTVTGNVTVSKDLTVTEELAVTGNVTTTSNIEVTGFVGSSGTGALTLPSGTT